MKFSEWTQRTENHVIDNAAGDHYESLPQTAKDSIDVAIERFRAMDFKLIDKHHGMLVENLAKEFKENKDDILYFIAEMGFMMMVLAAGDETKMKPGIELLKKDKQFMKVATQVYQWWKAGEQIPPTNSTE